MHRSSVSETVSVGPCLCKNYKSSFSLPLTPTPHQWMPTLPLPPDAGSLSARSETCEAPACVLPPSFERRTCRAETRLLDGVQSRSHMINSSLFQEQRILLFSSVEHAAPRSPQQNGAFWGGFSKKNRSRAQIYHPTSA